MADSLISSTVAVLTALIGVAIIAVLVSGKSSTASVISSGSHVFNTLVSEAVMGG